MPHFMDIQCAQSGEDIKGHAETCAWTTAPGVLVYSVAGNFKILCCGGCFMNVFFLSATVQ